VLAAHAFGFEHRADFPAGVAGVKLVHDIAERGEIVVAFQTVHTIVDGDQPDAALPQNLHNLADFQIVTPQAAHVLYDDGLHPSGLDFLHHRQKSGAVKTGSRYAIKIGRASCRERGERAEAAEGYQGEECFDEMESLWSRSGT